MSHAPIAFQSSEGRYHYEGVAQLINAFAEKRGQDGKGPLAVTASDGIIAASDDASGKCRGMIFMEDLDCLYSIHPSGAFKTTFDGTTFTTIRIGTVPGIDVVQLSRNQNEAPEITIKTDSGVMILSSDSLQYISDTDFPDDVVTAEYASGYTIVGQADRTFNISDIDDSLSWAALDFATFQQKAGKLVTIKENSGEIVGFCSSWMEFWRNTGGADFPFSLIGSRGTGLKAADAVVRSDNTLIFPGDDGMIYKLGNYDSTRISNHTVERLITSDPNAEDIIGYSWQHDGHDFAVFSGTDWTRCYDSATKVWHTRASFRATDWRARFTAAAPSWGKIMVGDALTGQLGYFDRDTYTEFGDPIVWGVDSPPLHVFPDGGIIDALHIDIATGYGLLSGQGSDPKIMLELSKDGGNTFQQYRELSLGVQGKYATRVTARNLGRLGPKGVTFRLRISDPVARSIVNTDIEVRRLKR